MNEIVSSVIAFAIGGIAYVALIVILKNKRKRRTTAEIIEEMWAKMNKQDKGGTEMKQKLEHCVRGTDYGCGGATFSEVIDKVNEVIDYINSRPEEIPPCQTGFKGHEDPVGRRGRQGMVPRWISEKAEEYQRQMEPPYDSDDIISAYESGAMWNDKRFVYGATGDPDPAGTSDLEEAAKEYASKTLCDPDDGPSTGLVKDAFIAGAEWQEKQVMQGEDAQGCGGYGQ